MNINFSELIKKIIDKKFKATYQNQDGYDSYDVDQFLDQVNNHLANFSSYIKDLEQKYKNLEYQNNQLKKIIDQQKSTIVSLDQKIKGFEEAGYDVLSIKNQTNKLT